MVIKIIKNFKNFSSTKIFKILENFTSSIYFWRAIGLSVISLIHPIPYVESYFEVFSMGVLLRFRLHTILNSFIFLRVYFIMEFVCSFSAYFTIENEMTCKKLGFEINKGFILKCFQKDYPFFNVALSLTTVTLIGGLILRKYEL